MTPDHYRCSADGCPSKAQCHLARPVAKGEFATMTAMWVRRGENEMACDQFVAKELKDE